MPNFILVSNPDVCIVTTTLPSVALANTIANHLVTTGLVACTQCSAAPVTSTYFWKGALEVSHEVTLTAKTTRAAVHDVCSAIRQMHPYDVAEILVADVTLASDSYTRWVHESVHPA